MKNQKIRLALCVLCGLGSSLTYAALLTVGEYDPTAQANQVDNDILTPGTLITAQPTGAFGVSAFTTDVASAFANNMGGVIDFESGDLGEAAHLGVDHSLGLNLTFTGDSTPNLITETEAGAGKIPISGESRVDTNRELTIAFGSFFDVATNNTLSDYRITQVGLTMLARDNRDWSGSVTATFSDSTTAFYTIADLGKYGTPTDPDNPPEDTFLGFTAPTGQGITQIAFANTSTDQFALTIDDLGIVAIPEPGTLVLVGIALGSLLLFRRR